QWDSAPGGQVMLDSTSVSPRLQASARDFATGPAGLLADSPITLPPTRSYHLLDSRLLGATNHRHLLQGVDLAPGGVARRRRTDVALIAPEIENAVRTRRNLQALAEARSGELVNPNQILSQIGPMLAKMPGDQGAPAAFAVANQFVRNGQ